MDAIVVDQAEFSARVGCSISMASRLRSGERLPSLAMLIKISEAFDIAYDDLMAAYRQGPVEFSACLREQAFGEPSD